MTSGRPSLLPDSTPVLFEVGDSISVSDLDNRSLMCTNVPVLTIGVVGRSWARKIPSNA